MFELIVPVELFITILAFLLSQLIQSHNEFGVLSKMLDSKYVQSSPASSDDTEVTTDVFRYRSLLKYFARVDYIVRSGFLIIIFVLSFLTSYPFYEVWGITPGRDRQILTLMIVALLALIFWIVSHVEMVHAQGKETFDSILRLQQSALGKKLPGSNISAENSFWFRLRRLEWSFSVKHKKLSRIGLVLALIIMPSMMITFHFWWGYLWSGYHSVCALLKIVCW
jgi:hypothetical protein